MRPNILLLVMDATRFDHLSCYGYRRNTSPNLERLAEDGVLYQNAFSAAPWTPPSFASLFTGCYPSRHKVTGKNLVFNKDLVTLPQVLLAHGYNTACFSTTAGINLVRGFGRGFDNFVEIWRRSKRFRQLDYKAVSAIIKKLINGGDKYTNYMTKMMKKWIRNNQLTGNPFFICAHYHNPHSPYKPPRPYNKMFSKEMISKYDMGKLKGLSKRGGYGYMAKTVPVTKEEFDVLKSWYDGEIAYLDFRINELIEYMKESGLYENTLIVITADHGENFGEHDLMYHQFCLYDTLIHVPLMIIFPSLVKGGRRIDSLVSLIDLFPTLLDILGIDASEYGHVNGRSIASFKNEVFHPCIFAEYEVSEGVLRLIKEEYEDINIDAFKRGIKCIRNLEYKLVQYSNGDEEFYDLRNDAAENNNLAKERFDVKDDLKNELRKWTKSFEGAKLEPKKLEEDEEMRSNLEALGYL